MKAKEVLSVLRISRATLHNYLADGKITATTINGRHNYDSKSVYALINKVEKVNYVYARVSTQKQKSDLTNQIDKLKSFCFAKGIQIGGVYKDIGSGISFDKRKDFMIMLQAIIDYRVSIVIISHKDRLSRIGFGMFKNLFANYGVEIIVMDDTLNEKTDTEEIFEDIVSLLHCYSMKFYSKRKAIKKALD